MSRKVLIGLAVAAAAAAILAIGMWGYNTNWWGLKKD